VGDFAEQGAFMDAEPLGGSQAVVVAFLQGLADGFRFQEVPGRADVDPGIGAFRVIGHFPGKMGKLDDLILTEDESPFDDVFQFPDVAGPVVSHEQGQDFAADSVNRAVLEAVEVFDELVGQQRDILFPLPQRRELQSDHVDPVIEVLPESLLFHQFGEVPMGGGEDTYIRGFAAGGAERLEGLFLEDPQQTHLQGRAHLADLVQKQGAAVGQGETPRFVPGRSGEGPGLVPEQLRFQQGVGQGSTVDRNKRPFATGTQFVEGAGDEFLAGAGFAGDQYGAGAGRDRREDFEDVLHARTVADQVADPEVSFQFPPQRLDFTQVPESFGSADDAPRPIPQGRGGDADGNAGPFGVDDVARAADDGPAVADGFAQGAFRLAHAAAEDLGAEPADGLLPRRAGDLFRGPVEGGDAPLQIDRKHPVRDAFQYRLGGGVDQRCGVSLVFFHSDPFPERDFSGKEVELAVRRRPDLHQDRGPLADHVKEPPSFFILALFETEIFQRSLAADDAPLLQVGQQLSLLAEGVEGEDPRTGVDAHHIPESRLFGEAGTGGQTASQEGHDDFLAKGLKKREQQGIRPAGKGKFTSFPGLSGRFFRFVVLCLFPGKPFFEVFHALSQVFSHLGEFAGTEKDQHQYQDDEQFLQSQSEHVRFLREKDYGRGRFPAVR
jgi:hypothetical protein